MKKVILDNWGRRVGLLTDDLAPGIRAERHPSFATRSEYDPSHDPEIQAATRMLELDLRDTAAGKMSEAAFWAKYGTDQRELLTRYLYIHRLWAGVVTEEEFDERYPELGAAAMMKIRR